MGPTAFFQQSSGPNIEEAFRTALEAARYEYGHRGDTGTLADKTTYTIVSDQPLPGHEAEARARQILDDDAHPHLGKWGPAGAIRIQDGREIGETWLFFGWTPC